MEEVREEEEEGGAGARRNQRSFFCPLVRDPDTWGQRGLDGFRLKARLGRGRTHYARITHGGARTN